MNVGYLNNGHERRKGENSGLNLPLLDDVVKLIDWFILFQAFCATPLPAAQCSREFLCKRFVLS